MTGNEARSGRGWLARALIGVATLLVLASWTSAPVVASTGDRTICFHHTHTLQDGCFTFRKNGQYDQAVLRQLNVFLADWRTKDVIKMDPQLFDLIWEIYQEVGGRNPVNIVSSYRTPKTNAMLHAKSSAVAENSQHMLGKAMDIFIPGVDLYKLRATAMRHQVGGVGYYPTSGSPFVHVDTGTVRAWPRMTTAQLSKVFPDGKTLHLPLDGKPLSNDGRAYAQAQWNTCHKVPCNGVVAPVDTGLPEIVVASVDAPQRTVSTIGVNVFPAQRPGFFGPTSATAIVSGRSAPIPAGISPEIRATALAALPVNSQTALGALDQTVPQPRVLMTPKPDVLTAYAPDITPDEGAQRALQILIERETTASAKTQATPEAGATVASLDPAPIRTRPTGGTNGLDAFSKMFDLTWTAVTQAGSQPAIAASLASSTSAAPVEGLVERQVDLVAPETDHIYDLFGTPEPISSLHYAELYEPEGYLDRAAELGPLASRMTLESNLVAPEAYDRFVRRAPELVATR